jgi:excinuclease UvrABC nuclease subunit
MISDPLMRLIDGGFREVGAWELHPFLQVQFIGKAPIEPGIYAFTENGEVRYVGSAQKGIHRRFCKYTNPNNTGKVAVRIRAKITKALISKSQVRAFAVVIGADPTSWNALPINIIAGLEEGLIRQLRPSWNLRGLGALVETHIAHNQTETLRD